MIKKNWNLIVYYELVCPNELKLRNCEALAYWVWLERIPIPLIRLGNSKLTPFLHEIAEQWIREWRKKRGPFSPFEEEKERKQYEKRRSEVKQRIRQLIFILVSQSSKEDCLGRSLFCHVSVCNNRTEPENEKNWRRGVRVLRMQDHWEWVKCYNMMMLFTWWC